MSKLILLLKLFTNLNCLTPSSILSPQFDTRIFLFVITYLSIEHTDNAYLILLTEILNTLFTTNFLFFFFLDFASLCHFSLFTFPFSSGFSSKTTFSRSFIHSTTCRTMSLVTRTIQHRWFLRHFKWWVHAIERLGIHNDLCPPQNLGA